MGTSRQVLLAVFLVLAMFVFVVGISLMNASRGGRARRRVSGVQPARSVKP